MNLDGLRNWRILIYRFSEERLTKEKELALETLKNKLEADISLLKQQHSQEVEEILHTFEGISLEEVDSNRALIQVRHETDV